MFGYSHFLLIIPDIIPHLLCYLNTQFPVPDPSKSPCAEIWAMPQNGIKGNGCPALREKDSFLYLCNIHIRNR